jgi:hypothetical protein
MSASPGWRGWASHPNWRARPDARDLAAGGLGGLAGWAAGCGGANVRGGADDGGLGALASCRAHVSALRSDQARSVWGTLGADQEPARRASERRAAPRGLSRADRKRTSEARTVRPMPPDLLP